MLKTSQIDYNGRFCMSAAAAAGNRAFGLDRGPPFRLDDIRSAECVLLVGSNVAETMPPFMQRLGQGRSLVVVDPRRTATAATLHLAPQPGTDLALANGLLFLAIELGLVDTGYVGARTTGWDAVRSTVAGYWPGRVERLTGVAEPDLREAVRLLAIAPTAMVLTARGAEQHAHSVDTTSAWINLALALGLPGRPGSGFGTLTGQGNGQGGREHGQKADQLPGYRSISDPAARAHVAAVWGIDPADLPGPGRSAYELLDALGDGGGPGALLLLGSNPFVSAPNARHVAQRLASLDCLVVADLVLSETAALADVVLPTAQWAEEDGTTTNLEGRVLLRRKAIDPPAGVRTDLEILHELAARLDRPAGFPTDASAAQPEEHEPVSEGFPLRLTTGRVAMQYQSGAQTRRVEALPGTAYVELHEDLAARLGVLQGERVRVSTVRGQAYLPAKVSDAIRADTMFVPFHWAGKQRANSLTSDRLDPVSQMPAFKVCAARIDRVAR